MHSCCAFFSGCLCSSNLGVWPVPHCDLLATPGGRFHRSLCCRKCVSCWGDAVVVSAGVVGKHCACAHLECWPHQVGVMIAVFMFVSETLGFGRAAVALKCPSQIVVLTHCGVQMKWPSWNGSKYNRVPAVVGLGPALSPWAIACVQHSEPCPRGCHPE